MPDVRLFTREGCVLCDEALALVEREMARRLGPPRLRFQPISCGPTSVVRRLEHGDGSVLEVIDIDLEPDLRSSLGDQVPVVDIDGRRAFALRFDAAAFASAWLQTPPVVQR